MLNFSGLNTNTKKNKTKTRTIASLSSFDLNFVADTYKGGTMSFGNGGVSTDIFRYASGKYTNGYVENADGSLTATVGGRMRRSNLGLCVEQDRTNSVLWNRDLTNAVWTKTNITATKNQTGKTGVANAASSITATAANGTILQTITLVSAVMCTSAYVKRLNGTGTLEMTQDGGTTWTTVPTTTSWTRVSIPSVTAANPTVGFRIATSGDSFAIDFVQNENGPNTSTPQETTTAAARGWGDRATADDTAPTGNYNSPLPPLLRGGHGFYMELCAARPEQFGPLVSSGGPQARVETDGRFSYQSVYTGTGQFIRGAYTINKIAAYIKSDGTVGVCCNGNTVVKGTGVLGTSMTHIDLATNGSSAMNIHGLVRRVAFFGNGVLTDADLVNFTKP